MSLFFSLRRRILGILSRLPNDSIEMCSRPQTLSFLTKAASSTAAVVGSNVGGSGAGMEELLAADRARTCLLLCCFFFILFFSSFPASLALISRVYVSVVSSTDMPSEE